MAIILEGVQNVMSRLSDLLSNTGGLAKEGMADVLNDIWQRAADRAPKDTGALRGSASMWIDEENNEIVGEVQFNEPYAAAQHEHVEYQHPQGGEAKYLEKAALEKLEQIRERVAAGLSELFGGL